MSRLWICRITSYNVCYTKLLRIGTDHGYTYEALSYRKKNKKMEPFLVTVNERAPEENLYSHEGEEFLRNNFV